MNSLRFLGLSSFRRYGIICKVQYGIIYKVQCCSFGSHPLKYVEMQNYWRKKDNVPKNWELIYKAPMDRVFNLLTTYITVSTSFIAGFAFYHRVISYDSSKLGQPIFLGDSDILLADNINECLIYVGAFIAIHLMAKLLISKYVLRIYKNDDKYLAIFRGHFYNQIKKHEFHINEFKKSSPTYFVSWGDARFSLGGKYGIILEPYFKTPHHFNYLLTKKKLEDYS